MARRLRVPSSLHLIISSPHNQILSSHYHPIIRRRLIVSSFRGSPSLHLIISSSHHLIASKSCEFRKPKPQYPARQGSQTPARASTPGTAGIQPAPLTHTYTDSRARLYLSVRRISGHTVIRSFRSPGWATRRPPRKVEALIAPTRLQPTSARATPGRRDRNLVPISQCEATSSECLRNEIHFLQLDRQLTKRRMTISSRNIFLGTKFWSRHWK